jgi:carboxyl-terminal processing protease
MANNLLRSIGLVSAIALVPAATAAFATADVDTYRELDQFMSVFERVRAEYVEQVDDKTLLRGAIDGMLASLDPHSNYLDEKGFQSLMTQTDGEYGGLGLNVTMEDGAVKVIAATEDTPAERAGIKAGDYITHINGKLIYGGTLDEAVDQMRGPPGTPIKITIVRPGRDKPFDVPITRAIISLPAVKWEIKERVGILNVNSFNKTTTDATLAAMVAIEKSLGGPPLGYVLDLRSNPGGLLDQAIDLSDAFLQQGEIVSQRGRQKGDIKRYYAKPGDAARGLPVIVLVDAGSA